MQKNRYWLVLAAAITLSGCTFLNKTPLSGLTEKISGVEDAVKNKVTEEMFKDVADPLVRKNMVAMMNQGKFRMTSQFGVGKDLYISHTETEMKGEGYSSKSSQEKDGKITNEMIMIDSTTYVKDYADNAWWKQVYKPEEVREEFKDVIGDFKPEEMKEMFNESASSTFTKVSEEVCPAPNGNLTCYKYKETYSQGGDRTWWFDVKQYLTRREENGVGEGKMTADYSYDNISIVVPTPTKEVPQGKSIYEMMMGQSVEMSIPTGGEQPDYAELMKQYGQQVEGQMPVMPDMQNEALSEDE